ncbi:T9SS type A sorting domain-containing protein [Bernardetia sp. ABR2-2B]|uniref:T9SS type A sorting domain-containing protein n=1 Tax=Bernardetia sp. ABR2-2B TaxID=3127472 RepID=UPI0030D17C8F
MKTSIYFTLLLFFSSIFSAQALVCTSLGDGVWSDASNWSCGRVPDTNNDIVIIAHDILLDQDVTLLYDDDNTSFSLTINPGASLVDDGGNHTLQIGQGSGNGYNGINVEGVLDVYTLTLQKAQSPSSILASTGEIIVRCQFDTSNRGDILVEGFLDIRGDWLLGNGNTQTTGTGSIIVEGCLDTGGGGQPSNIEPEYCIVRPNNGCLCGGNPNNAVDEADSNADGNGNNGGSRNECLNILPVTYLSFTAKVEKSTATSNAKSIIEWITVSEINHDRFVLERSYAGKIFEEVTTIKAKGGKNILTTYNFIDESLVEEGVYYYRLKEISPSDEIAYSPVVTITVGADLFFKVFPNPVSQGQKLYIRYPNKIKKIQIKTTQGKIVFELSQDAKHGSDIEIPVNLPKGLYMIDFSTPEGTEYRRLIVE